LHKATNKQREVNNNKILGLSCMLLNREKKHQSEHVGDKNKHKLTHGDTKIETVQKYKTLPDHLIAI